MRVLLQVAVALCLFLGSAFAPTSRTEGQTGIGHPSETSSQNAGTSSGHSRSSGRTVAVVYSDIKFDDKMAIHILLQHERASHQRMYDLVIVVINAIVDVEGANIDLRDFLGGMGSYQKKRLVVLKGTYEIENEASSHEVNFVGKQNGPKGTLLDCWKTLTQCFSPSQQKTDGVYERDIGRFLQNTDTVHLYQIAPTPSRYLRKIMDQPVHMAMYHLVHGYNTWQDATNDVHKKFDFVKSIKNIFPLEQSTVVFTNNYGSFEKGKIGDTQPYSEFEGRVPEQHLHAALMDPFYVKELQEVVQILNLPAGALTALFKEHGYKNLDERELVRLFMLARVQKADENGFNPRATFLKFISEHVQSAIDAKPMEGALKKLLTVFDELTVELCDANHVVQVLTAHQFQPMQFELKQFGNGRQDLIFVEQGRVNPDEKDGDSLYGLTKEDCMKKMRPFLPATTAAH